MDNNVQKYRALIKAIECSSFTKAAEQLNYSQSGISRMIADLEKEWNLTLLERGRSGVFLTSEGMQLLPYIKSFCLEHDRLKQQIDVLNQLQTGIIRIAAFSSVATHWLPQVIKSFHQDFPGVNYELVMGNYTEIENWIIEGSVDCGFLSLPTNPKLDTFLMPADEFFVVLPESHPLADCETFPIQALCDDPFILPRTGNHIDVEEIFKKHNIHPDIHYSTFDDYAIMSMVESGLGISILPGLILRRIPYHILLKPLEIPAYRQIGFCVRDKDKLPLAVERFLAYLMQAIKDQNICA